MKTKFVLASTAALALIGFGSDAWAGPKIFSSGVTRVNGTVEFNANNNRDPWLAQVFSSGGECLRIAVVSQGSDLEATLLSPSGRAWQDDDSGGLNRPLIQVQTDVRGWYPLMVNHWSGTAVNVDFSMDIQRGSCTPTTSPLVRSNGITTDRIPKGASNGPRPSGGPN